MRFPLEALPGLLAAGIGIGLALLLLRVGRERRACVALALLLSVAALANVAYFLSAAQTATYPYSVLFVVGQAFGEMDGLLVACFGAMLLAERASVPRALQAFPTYLVPAAGLFVLAILRPDLVFDTAAFVAHPRVEDAPAASFPWEHPQVLLLVDRVTDLAWVVVPLLLVRAALKESAQSWASTLAIATAMASVFAFYAASEIVDPTIGGSASWSRTWTRGIVAANLACQGALVLYLIVRAARAARERRGLAWGSAVLLVALWGAGAWVGSSDLSALGVQAAFTALIALPFPLIASYALLRHQLLGLDVKLRFAISKSTLAAIFIAVFFVASESAQQLLGDTLGSTYVGIAVAGALVFALAPLQRAAERLAERAVPVASTEGSGGAAAAPSDREAAYRRAVRLALRDRQLSREEEMHLVELAHHLGIAPLQATRIHVEVEQEVRG